MSKKRSSLSNFEIIIKKYILYSTCSSYKCEFSPVSSVSASIFCINDFLFA